MEHMVPSSLKVPNIHDLDKRVMIPMGSDHFPSICASMFSFKSGDFGYHIAVFGQTSAHPSAKSTTLTTSLQKLQAYLQTARFTKDGI